MTLSDVKKKYTKVTGVAGSWNATLIIDYQSFHVVEGRTKKEARWYSKMLAVALKRLIDANQKDSP